MKFVDFIHSELLNGGGVGIKSNLGILWFRVLLVFSLLLLPLLFVTTICCAQDSPQVLFDESGPYGKFYTIYNVETYGASSFAAMLEENGFTVSRLTDKPITSDKLKGYSTLILMAPGRNYTSEELNSIKEFLVKVVVFLSW